jgi:hypothetical protein
MGRAFRPYLQDPLYFGTPSPQPLGIGRGRLAGRLVEAEQLGMPRGEYNKRPQLLPLNPQGAFLPNAARRTNVTVAAWQTVASRGRRG